MITIHDIVEAIAGDIPAFEQFDNDVKTQKIANEIKAIESIREELGSENGGKFYNLWYEFENKVSNESKVANALDKLEAQIQHNEADIDTWLDIEKEMLFMLDKHVNFNNFLTILKDVIVQEGITKLKSAELNN